jgi:hypothetical protein
VFNTSRRRLLTVQKPSGSLSRITNASISSSAAVTMPATLPSWTRINSQSIALRSPFSGAWPRLTS